MIVTRFNQNAINFLKGYALKKRPCGTYRFVKIRNIVRIKKQLLSYPYQTLPFEDPNLSTTFAKIAASRFYYSDGTIVYEQIYSTTYKNQIFRCSYLVDEKNRFFSSTIWVDSDFENFLQKKGISFCG